MTEQQIQSVLTSLFDAFPTLAEFYRRNRETMKPAWVKALSYADYADTVTIVDRMICGELDMPANYEYDRIAIILRRESGLITSERNQRKTQTEKYFRGLSDGAMAFVRNSMTGHIAIELGEMCKRGHISYEENKAYMSDLKAWDKGGNVPRWMTELFGVDSAEKNLVTGS